MSLSANEQITDQDLYLTTTVQGGQVVGQVMTTTDNRVFRYSQAGATALAPGLLTNSTAAIANNVTRTLSTSFPAGSSSITFTAGGTIAQDLYRDGYLVVTDGTGKGQVFTVIGNTAATAGNANSVTVRIGESVNTPLDNTSVVGLYANLSKNVVLAAASAAVPVTGVPVIPVPANSFYWSQIGGLASILMDATPPTKNAGAIVSAATQGAASIELAASVTQRIGYAPEAGVATKYSPLVLTIVQ